VSSLKRQQWWLQNRQRRRASSGQFGRDAKGGRGLGGGRARSGWERNSARTKGGDSGCSTPFEMGAAVSRWAERGQAWVCRVEVGKGGLVWGGTEGDRQLYMSGGGGNGWATRRKGREATDVWARGHSIGWWQNFIQNQSSYGFKLYSNSFKL
jgi:hypothetical protein